MKIFKNNSSANGIVCIALSLFLINSIISSAQVSQNTDNNFPMYNGNDLGVQYDSTLSIFKIWSPMAEMVRLNIYNTDSATTVSEKVNLNKSEKGVWEIAIKKDLKNKYYTFQIQQDKKWLQETPDPYAKAVGVNGKRAMIIDLKETNPENWSNDKYVPLKNATEAILYELHIRDFSINANSGMKNKGKYAAFTEINTKTPLGNSSGLDHIKELGVTHIHLLPAFDFSSIDESKPDLKQYNWGYDPLNYNTPEGSYSTNPSNGGVRIKEFKRMVQSIHNKGIGVIMDVVYNHTSSLTNSPFALTVPGYFYRQNPDESFSDATGCGNETASEKDMMRKYMIESVCYWAKEYHIDGFRFDLMGVHDIETMNLLSEALHKINPNVFIYGEGWTAGASPLNEELRAIKRNTYKLNGIAAFSDDMRDGIKGQWNNERSIGFASGNVRVSDDVKFGIVGATYHKQIRYDKVSYSKTPWAKEPTQCINYASCHDNHTLYDKLKISVKNANDSLLIKMDKLSNAIVLTSQGVPFIHAGEEMIRTKKGVENSYKSADSINAINWSNKDKNLEVFNYYKSLIELRKNHPAFRMPTNAIIQENILFLQMGIEGLIAYVISNNANGDKWNRILVMLNGSTADRFVSLPDGDWTLVADGSQVNENGIKKISDSKITLSGSSAFIFYQD
jgi:pullulanase